MPWKETCRMDEKLVFVADCLRGELPMAALCGDYGISRKTGYKWLGRYREQGPEGLVERSRAPHRPRSVDGAGDGRSDCRSAPGASPLGSAQAARSADGRAPRGGVACGQHDGRSAACGRAGGLPPTAPSRGRARPAVPHRHRTQRCLVHRLQGLVPHPRRRTLRPLDRQRRPQPFPAGLRHRPAPDRHGPCGGRAALQALRPASGHPLGQRGTVRRNGRGRTVSSVGRLDQGRHRVGAHRAGPAPAERTARAHASDLEGRDGQNRRPRVRASSRSASTASARTSTTTVPTRRLASSRLRRSTGPRCGLTPNAWPSPGTMPGTPCAGCAPTGPVKWGGRPGLHQRDAEGRTRRHRRDRQRRLDRSLRRHRPRHHRPTDQETSWLPRGPGRAAPKPNKLRTLSPM